MAAIVETRDLTKRYDSLVALDHLNLTIPEGAIYGFIGPNGAGKTTTMRILTALLKPTSGEARVAGHEVTRDPRAIRRLVGWMPDSFGVYDNMKAWEYLDFFAASYGVPEQRRKQQIEELLDLVDLSGKRDEYVMGLSRGMKQRLSLARTMAHDPRLLILDEPASGLDPRARIELRELLKELRSLGKTIMISSHILTELAEMCTHIGIIEAGRLLITGEVNQILASLQPHRTIEVHVLAEAERAQALLRQMPGVREVRLLEPAVQVAASDQQPIAAHSPADAQAALAEVLPGTSERTMLYVDFVGDDAALSAILHGLTAAGVPVVHFAGQVSDLEDIFMQVTRGVTQ
ncbi:MAG TPA: ABC transporter ATP-binding protein [Herpetosiphonaceae bacterium]